MARHSRGRKNKCSAGHGNQKIKSHVTRNEDETAARYESQTDSALKSKSTAGSGSQSKEAGSEAPSPLTTGKGKRHGDLLSHKFSASEKGSELPLSNGSSSSHDSAVSSCDGVSSCSSPSLEALSSESGCEYHKDTKTSDQFGSFSHASPSPQDDSEEAADDVVFSGCLGRKNMRRRRQRKYKRLMLRQKREREMESIVRGMEYEVKSVSEEAESEASEKLSEAGAEASEEVAQCTATPALSGAPEIEDVTVIINDNLQTLNGPDNTKMVDFIPSPTKDGEDIEIHQIFWDGDKDIPCGIRGSRPKGYEDLRNTGRDVLTGNFESPLIAHFDKLELVEVVRADNENIPDTHIFEFRKEAFVEEETEEMTISSNEVSDEEEGCDSDEPTVSDEESQEESVEDAVAHDTDVTEESEVEQSVLFPVVEKCREDCDEETVGDDFVQDEASHCSEYEALTEDSEVDNVASPEEDCIVEDDVTEESDIPETVSEVENEDHDEEESEESARDETSLSDAVTEESEVEEVKFPPVENGTENIKEESEENSVEEPSLSSVSETVTEEAVVDMDRDARVSPDAETGSVDAALAELDSIPDEVCEAGDVEEEDEEEEEWSYYRMDLQTQPQAEDVLVPGSSAPLQDSEVMDQDQGKVPSPAAEDSCKDQPPHEHLEQESEKIQMPSQADVEQPVTKSPELFQTIEHAVELNKESNLMETSISNVGDYLDNTEPPSSPPAPGSPRSVEGFVTSVELNTPEESLGTNFPASHTQDFNGSEVGQPSGPFSVYVSSSPEPVSLDPLQASGDFNGVSDMTNGQMDNETVPAQPEDFSPVEIVHAQSTVEVLASPPSEKRESEVPSEIESNILDMETSKVPVNQMSDVTFIPEPVVEPVAEEPVPVFIEEGTPVSEGEPEIPHEFSTDTQAATEPVTADLLSKEELAAHETETSFRVEETPSPEFPGSEQASLLPEAVSPLSAPGSPCMEPETASPGPESAPAPVSPEVEVEEFQPMESSPLPLSPVTELQAPMSPFKEVTPVSESSLVQASPEPAVLLEEPSPAPNSQVTEPLVSLVEEPAQIPVSAAAVSPDIEPEPSPAPVSPVIEPSPAPVSPVVEPEPVLASPVVEPEPVLASPVMESMPVLASPVMEPMPVLTSPVMEPMPVLASPVMEPKPVLASPVMEPEPALVSSVVESSPVPPVTEVLAPSPTIVTESVEPSVPEPSVVEQEPALAPVVTKESEPEVKVPVTEEKDEILINKGTVVIPVVPQEEVKEPEPEVVKSPAKSTKALAKAAADKPGKATPARATPGRSTPSKTAPSPRTPTKSAEKKSTPLRSTPKTAPTTRAAPEKTTTTTTTTRPATSRIAPSATRQPATKPAAKPLPKTTTTKPSTATTKPAERKVPKPPTPTAPRATLSKPSAAASKPSTTKPSTATARTTSTTATKRPVSAPTKKVEKTDSTKVNGTTAKPLPRTTTTRPATASTVTRKALSTSLTKPVPEKETKNTTNRILSTTAKSTQKASPGTARALSTRSTATGQSTLTKTTAKVNGTSPTTTTAKGKTTSVTKSSTATTKTTGIGAKKTLVTKTSGTKTKTTAAAASAKVEKSEVIVGSVANGENKIAHEETSVEIIEKCAAEDILQCTTTEQVINTETVELIVNGDH